MRNFSNNPSKALHMVGIGGVGMSALAQVAIDAGLSVSGSDRLMDWGDETPILRGLQRQGVRLYPQDGSGVHAGLSRLVISTAIESDNPDLLAARRLGLSVVHRATELASHLESRRVLAVTGTCGKSTVTAILGWLLAEAGLDPLVVNGAAIVGWDRIDRMGSVRKGDGPWAVIEADESDRSLLAFSPEHAVITNLSADHFNLQETRALFDRFRARVRGEVVEGEPAADDILESPHGGSRFRFEQQEFSVPLAGHHNLVNAWQAVRMARRTGLDAETLRRHLATFPGVERRLQRVGACGPSPVYDDYAHNPVKLSAVWNTLATGSERLVCVWRPHGYGPLRAMLDDLAEAFTRAMRPSDRLLLLPVYDAGGTARRTIQSETLRDKLRAAGRHVECLPDADAAERVLRAAAAPGTVLLVCGARDPGLPRLAHRLVTPLAPDVESAPSPFVTLPTPHALAQRARLLRSLRATLDARGCLEVETPVRIPAPAPEEHIECPPSAGARLRASPELQMKRLLAAGLPDLYQIGACFRAGERGRRHTPEFTLLEWYRGGTGAEALIDDCRALLKNAAQALGLGATLSYQGRAIRLDGSWHRVSVRDAFRRWAGWDPLERWDAERFDEDMTMRVEPSLPHDAPCILHAYPAQVASLARLHPSDPRTADRWELYLGGLELANAYGELTEGTEQRRRFREANEARRRSGRPPYPLDEEFLTDLDQGRLPSCAGIALGVDRLVMVLLDLEDIAQARAFCPPVGRLW